MADEHKACVCLECRIRKACGFDTATPVDITETILALGEVLSECLAHVSTKSAKQFAAKLLNARKKWQKHPRVAVQQPAQGNA